MPSNSHAHAHVAHLARCVVSHLDDGSLDTSRLPGTMGTDLYVLRQALDSLPGGGYSASPLTGLAQLTRYKLQQRADAPHGMFPDEQGQWVRVSDVRPLLSKVSQDKLPLELSQRRLFKLTHENEEWIFFSDAQGLVNEAP